MMEKELEEIFGKYTKDIDDLTNKEQIFSEKIKTTANFERLSKKRSEIKMDIFNFENSLRALEEETTKLIEERDNILNYDTHDITFI